MDDPVKPRRACRRICRECPFRRESWPGYLGNDNPTEFVNKAEAGVAMPCHMKVDYEQPDWEARAASAPLCRGALTYLQNNGKRPYVPPVEVPIPEFLRAEIPVVLDALDNGDVEPDRETVFTWRHEFIDHHQKGRLT